MVAWSRHVGTITDDEAKTLYRGAAGNPGEAESAYKCGIKLREVIYRIFTIGIEGQFPAREDLAVFNDYLAKAMVQSRIVKAQDGFLWEMTGNKAKLDWILSPVIRSAADLLVSEDLGRVKKCADPVCGWLFLDISRNRSRRWCDMRDCGNRAKASRFYKKKKGSKTTSSSSKTISIRSKAEPNLQRHLL
jgi:predicted RNA-binding Zn ribbon-like protein